MKRPYRNIGFLFLLLFVLVVAGFTPRVPGTPFFGYFSHLVQGAHVETLFHRHAASAVAWFALLTVQPFLIRTNRAGLHRLLGKLSIAVVALFFVTAIQVMKHFYAQGIATMPRDVVLSLLAQSFTALTLFIVFYAVALLKRRNLHQHVAFMVGAALAVATPGLARLGLYVAGFPGILLVIAFIYATLVGCLLYAKIRLHRPVSKSPYLIIIACSSPPMPWTSPAAGPPPGCGWRTRSCPSGRRASRAARSTRCQPVSAILYGSTRACARRQRRSARQRLKLASAVPR